ncbi:anaphase-promoting complex subunit 15B [Diaphorina citri]|uniref:Anaphase-promoting complex subunit 15B n=1 Tax=Diaphorina citri TaxID=121845 RepID=A0A1S3CXS5_DIACI|nr:anaphase-promoting complex subunit 15B [Diaphorina citri]KAI5713110.1 hypothetical protein M8J75_013789 [Diaphorina citri]KAI5748821.1 hypothetical protein M8J76_002225 [Diaphorina citri]KAI5749194.1 hypothetical protein M8J76_005392 [Diaphorina citri]KAI5755568.1 hypothetical protein M8J77_018027 [Diaphorina citri]
MHLPLFPELKPKVVDPLWFKVSGSASDEAELTQMEQQHQAWLNGICQKDCDLTPIGKTAIETNEEEEEDEEEEDDNEEEEDSSHEEDEDEEVDSYHPAMRFDNNSDVSVDYA